MGKRKQRGWRRDQLAYCSNVHPGESLEAVFENLEKHVGAVRRRTGLARMQTGLWLSAQAAGRLTDEDESEEMQRFCQLLEAQQLELVTLNGFPFGNFHATEVKQAVYQPDWSDPLRLAYTISLAIVLCKVLPAGHPGGTISTLPLGYAKDWSDAKHQQAIEFLCTMCVMLEEFHRRDQVPVQVCLEMEPGCVLESTADAIKFFKHDLQPAARGLGMDAATLHRYVGVCFDVCHQVVQFEDVGASLQQLHKAHIPVGKIQLSSALTAGHPAAAKDALSDFCEPRYLHQTRCQDADGTVQGVDDLPDALAGELPDDQPWRVHFHLPLQAQSLDTDGLGTTRDAVEQVLDWLAQPGAPRPHLEVETYTWHVLPPALRPTDDASLHRGIAAELDWAAGALDARGLLLDA